MKLERKEMKKKKLRTDFNWQHWSSTEADLKKMDPLIISRMLFDIFLINEFEHAVLKLQDDDCVWGPVHTSVGQEGVAAATIAALKKDDKIAGTHRAHHQFISKAINYILNESWDPIKEDLPQEVNQVVKRTLAEIMGLAPGYCGGRGGSMHLRYEEAGILGTNAIVSGGVPMATGAAYAEKYKKSSNVVVCFLGDGAVNQGAFHEACNLAGLWRLPIIYFIENNLYAVATHVEKTCAIKDISLRASSYNMDGFIVDGHDVTAIYKTMKAALAQIRKRGKPCIIEAKCYRHYHHAGDQPGSGFGYRSKAEEKEWLKKDAVANLLIKAGLLSKKNVQRIKKTAKESVFRAVEECTTADTPRVIRPELWPEPKTISFGIRSDGEELEGVNYREKGDFENFKEIIFSDAIAAVTEQWIEMDENVIELGEEVA
ncbi:MAG: thiamine pyrophosphate-dependent dehydrogenase E1 component subunit alpha, partial [Candidatus Omnitrophica bacterium]|nr:thiamine pyrophosphate-dependent dehydrogenase E1 component subunit alpha [Candidatus Omnitrophota bacterium]